MVNDDLCELIDWLESQGFQPYFRDGIIWDRDKKSTRAQPVWTAQWFYPPGGFDAVPAVQMIVVTLLTTMSHADCNVVRVETMRKIQELKANGKDVSGKNGGGDDVQPKTAV